MVKNKFQEHLEHLIFNHYKKNDFRDPEESRTELRKLFYRSMIEM